jgi:hypothetical protein
MQLLLAKLDVIVIELAALGVCLASGVLFRLTLSFVGQTWVRTFHHTMTYLLLPAITLVITKVISGNIALSLGMIGALSIVRFRNPVKNPLELVIFFALLTIGIAAGVSLKWSMFLTIVCITAFILMYYLERYFSSVGKSLFSLSFDEGNPAHLIEVTATKQMPELDASPSLQYSSHSKESGIYSYKLAFRDRESARKLDQALRLDEDIQHCQLRYANYL